MDLIISFQVLDYYRYYDSYRSEDLPANLIQAQRDYFGAHTYERKDHESHLQRILVLVHRF
jgi:6-phosphogluconate dehydrogenase